MLQQFEDSMGTSLIACRSDLGDRQNAAQAPTPWARAGLSAATQQALSGSRTQQGYPRSSPSKGTHVASSMQPIVRDSRQHSNSSLADIDSKSHQRSAIQQTAKSGGLDSIFARMSPGHNDDNLDRIDDDEDRDGNLLGGQEDSLYEAPHNWKKDKR